MMVLQNRASESDQAYLLRRGYHIPLSEKHHSKTQRFVTLWDASPLSVDITGDNRV